jgi:hypothetical protein
MSERTAGAPSINDRHGRQLTRCPAPPSSPSDDHSPHHRRATRQPYVKHVIVDFVRYRVHPSRRREFERAHQAAADVLGGVPGCHELEVAAAIEDPECYDVRIIWIVTEHGDASDRVELFPTFRGQAELLGYDMYKLRG